MAFRRSSAISAWNLFRHAEGNRTGLWRIGENADMIELLFLDEVEQVLELLVGFAWKPRDQSGAQHHIVERVSRMIEDAPGEIEIRRSQHPLKIAG